MLGSVHLGRVFGVRLLFVVVLLHTSCTEVKMCRRGAGFAIGHAHHEEARRFLDPDHQDYQVVSQIRGNTDWFVWYCPWKYFLKMQIVGRISAKCCAGRLSGNNGWLGTGGPGFSHKDLFPASETGYNVIDRTHNLWQSRWRDWQWSSNHYQQYVSQVLDWQESSQL